MVSEKDVLCLTSCTLISLFGFRCCSFYVTVHARGGSRVFGSGVPISWGEFDLCSLTNFTWNSPWKWNNSGSRGVRLNPPNPLWIRHWFTHTSNVRKASDLNHMLTLIFLILLYQVNKNATLGQQLYIMFFSRKRNKVTLSVLCYCMTGHLLVSHEKNVYH